MKTKIFLAALLFISSVMYAQGPPQIVYTYSKYISPSTAELHAGIRPNGTSFRAHFVCESYILPNGGPVFFYTTTQGYPGDTGLVEIIQTMGSFPTDSSFHYNFWVVISSTSDTNQWSMIQASRSGDPITTPKLIMLPPDSLGEQTVRLNAVCNTFGAPINFFFSWTTQEYIFNGSTSAHISLNSFNDTIISLPLTGLVPGAKYYILAIAQNQNDSEVNSQSEYDSLTMLSDTNARGLVTPLIVARNDGFIWTAMNFGVHTYATRCEDVALGEWELPPPAPEFDERFIDPHPGPTFCYGLGMYTDLRPFISSAQIDTYIVRISADPSEYPMTYFWPALDSSYVGPVWLRTIDDTIDMRTVSSITITDSDVAKMTIIAAGPRPPNHVPSVLFANPAISDSGSVILNAMVDPNGLSTTTWFEWGITTSYGSSSIQQQLNPQNGVIPVSALLQSVGENIVYHFRINTKNSFGVHYGADGEFIRRPVLGVKGPTTELPQKFELYQNYPNPFNPTTKLKFALPFQCNVRLVIYDVLGRVVATLIDGIEEAGFKSIDWDAEKVASGVYFYRLEATSTSHPAQALTQIKKMVLIR